MTNLAPIFYRAPNESRGWGKVASNVLKRCVSWRNQLPIRATSLADVDTQSRVEGHSMSPAI